LTVFKNYLCDLVSKTMDWAFSCLGRSFFLPGKILAAEASSWPLTSPDGHCAISVSLNDGNLNYQVASNEWHHEISPRGGFILRMNK
jgi:hypothetical protein